MTISAFDLQKASDETTDAGTNVMKRAVTSPSAGDVYYTRLDVGTGATLTEASSSAPLHVEIVDVTNTLVADVGSIKTAVEIVDDAVYADDADWTDGTSKHVLTGGLYQSSPQTITDGDVGPFQVTTNGYLITSVNGTVTVDLSTNNDVQGAAAEGAAVSGNPFLIAGDDGTNVKHVAVDASGNVQVDVVASLPAGSNTIGDVTISGDGLTALQLIDDPVATDDTSTHTAATTKVMGIGAVATPTDTTVDANDIAMPAMSTDRRLHTDTQIVGQDAALDVSGATVTVNNAGTFAVQISDTSFAVADGNALGEGVLVQGDDGTDRKNINVDATTGDVQVDVTNTVTVSDDGSFTLAANSGVDIGDVDVLSIAAGSNLIGDVGLSGARTTGGTTLYKNIDVDETEDQVKATAGQVYWIHAINLTAAPLYLKIYNATAATVVVGTTVPDLTFPVPANADSDGSGFTLSVPNGIAFDTAITVAGTTGVADADSGAPGANALVLNMGYA